MRTIRLLSPLLIPLFFAGCGGGGDQQLEAVSKQVASAECISCHIEALSPGTALSITQEWEASVHSTHDGAGCADCHDPAPGHPNSCNACHAGGGTPTGDEVSRNPDAAGKCGKCHGPAHPGDVLMRLAPQHYGYSSATQLPTKARASFVSDQYQGQCRACHNPHAIDVTTNHREYAKSLHGDPKGVAFTHYDFKQNNYASCQRCHTSTGFKYFIANNFTSRTTGFSTGATTRELIACDACHAGYDYKRSIRQVPAFTATYKNFNNTAAASYPDSGRSNLCIPCHSGRESAQALNAVANFGNAGFINSHYLAAAGLMYMQLGFINFTSLDAPVGSTTYGRSLSPDSLTTPGGIVGGTSSTHRKFGTPLIRGDFHNASFFVAGRADSNGPCVTCHLNVTGAATRAGHGHSLKIDGNAFRQLCVNCHNSEGTHTEVLQLNAENFRSKFLEPQAEAFEESLALLEHEIAKYGVSFNEAAYPYFFDENLPLLPTGKPPVKDWTRGGVLDGRKFMGACFNFNLLKREPAAYAHARSYSRRLIYDSIDYVDDRAMNLSVSATALASGLTLPDGTPAFVKDAQAYNTSGGAMSTIYGATSEPMLYLVGWSRSTGAWNAMERP